MMTTLLSFFILIPLLGFIISIVVPRRYEKQISQSAFITTGIQLLLAQVFVIIWAFSNFPVYNIKEFVLFKTSNYEFFVDLYFDKVSAVYLVVGAVLTFLVTIYSRYYLHRERGYKRFFVTILFFYLGYNITILAGNFETLFIGWELLGTSSFLLIAYYRDRYLPVKNAMKVYSLYRIADVAMLLAMWMSHHLWHHNITFLELNNVNVVHSTLEGHLYTGIFISVIISLAAAIKSGQFPFSSWLPRAMEGPTPSSAIFYSSLAVHIGAFLLLRTFPFWKDLIEVRVIIIVMGLISTIITSLIARVQSTIKSQIAYSSAAQIGIIFIEIALGFDNLALFHFASNAFLRSYQLLVSPSVVTYLIREQFYKPALALIPMKSKFIQKIKFSVYILSVKEWNMDSMMFRYLWNPLKKAGRLFKFINFTALGTYVLIFYVGGVYLLFNEHLVSPQVIKFLPTAFSIVGLVLVLRSFTERKNVKLAWVLVIFNHFWVALAISFNEHFSFSHNLIYLSGVVGAGIVGYICIIILRKRENKTIGLNGFYGYVYEYPRLSLIFFLSCIGLAGFPISPTFVGEDLIFSHIHQDQFMLAIFVSLSFILDGLALIRIFSRVFLGPHIKTDHEVAYRSA